MEKVQATIIMDIDVFDELCSYPEHRVKILDEEYVNDIEEEGEE